MGEKDKYMKLAEFEAETICNLEKENFKLSEMLSQAEKTIMREKEKFKTLETNHLKCQEEMQTQIMEGIQKQSYSSKELLDVQSFLLQAKKEIFELKSENERLKVKERLVEATESDLDMILKRELQTEDIRGFMQKMAETDKMDGNRIDILLTFIFSFLAFLLGFIIKDSLISNI